MQYPLEGTWAEALRIPNEANTPAARSVPNFLEVWRRATVCPRACVFSSMFLITSKPFITPQCDTVRRFGPKSFFGWPKRRQSSAELGLWDLELIGVLKGRARHWPRSQRVSGPASGLQMPLSSPILLVMAPRRRSWIEEERTLLNPLEILPVWAAR